MADEGSIPVEENKQQEYYARYYEKNKERLAAEKRSRYRNDPEYRKAARDRAKLRRRELSQQEKETRKKTGVVVSRRGPREPKSYMIKVNDTPMEVMMYTLGQVAKILRREIQTVRKWERDGVIPKPTYRSKGKSGYRLYTQLQVDGIRDAYRAATMTHGASAVRRRIKTTGFPEAVKKLWLDYPYGVKLT